MRRYFLAAAILCGLHNLGQADPLFYNITGTQYSVIVTQPNGEKATEPIAPGISNPGSRAVSLPGSVKQAKAEFQDDLGSTLWAGTVENDYSYVAVPSAGGKFSCLPAGFTSGDNYLRAALIADLTGQNFKVDFVGQLGLDAQRGLTYGSTFDKSKAFRFHPKEDQYKVRLTDSSGTTYDCGNTLGTGRYYILFKNGEGKYEISMLGCIKR